jgi:hypothetical protein
MLHSRNGGHCGVGRDREQHLHQSHYGLAFDHVRVRLKMPHASSHVFSPPNVPIHALPTNHMATHESSHADTCFLRRVFVCVLHVSNQTRRGVLSPKQRTSQPGQLLRVGVSRINIPHVCTKPAVPFEILPGFALDSDSEFIFIGLTTGRTLLDNWRIS